jgi:hypothetical protein
MATPSNPAAMNSRTPATLDQIQIASPCNARWEDMEGGQRARFCGQCRKHVFNLSAMTRAEVETLVQEKEGRFCGRFFRRADGTLLTADCPTEQRRRRNRLSQGAGTLFAALLFFFGLRASVRSQEANQHAKAPALLGDVAVAPPWMGKIAAPTNPPAIKTNSTVPSTPRGK